MSQIYPTTILLPTRGVVKRPDGQYYVYEKVHNSKYFKRVSKGYMHSTSAFAALGRLQQASMYQAMGIEKGKHLEVTE